MGIQLKVGQTVRLRSGAIDKVCGHDASQASTGIEFQLESGGSYWADGHWIRDQDTPLDVVEIISEPADCVVKELRELTAHVTKELAELHERIARLERRPIISDDPTDNAIPILDINGEVIRGGDICELVLSKCRMVAKFDIDGDHWFESVVAKERMSADDFPAHIVNGEQRYKGIRRVGVSSEWDGQPDSPGDPFAVDWSEMPGWARVTAVDGDGERWYYSHEPELSATEWICSRGDRMCRQSDDIKPPPVGWRDSLRLRPE